MPPPRGASHRKRTTKAPAGINSFPAIDGDTLLVGAGTPGLEMNPHFQLVAYALR